MLNNLPTTGAVHFLDQELISFCYLSCSFWSDLFKI